MALKSKQKKIKEVVSKTGVTVSSIYCRRCMETKAPSNFWSATDSELDKNGFMSVCSSCSNEMFDEYINQGNPLELAVLKMCQKLNMKFDPAAIESAKLQIETVRASGRSIPPFLSIYKIKLVSTQNREFGDRQTDDLTYSEVVTINVSEDLNPVRLNDEVDKEVIMFWGNGFTREDYEWLEVTMNEWKKTHRSDTMSEQVLLKEIVMKQFEIMKTREVGKPVTSSSLKDLQDLMRTASVDPAKASQASGGRSNDTFSSFIKIIEERRPAEYYQDKTLFEDFDNIEEYFNKYIVRPLKNFITGSRDFSLEQTDDESEEEIDPTRLGDEEGEV